MAKALAIAPATALVGRTRPLRVVFCWAEVSGYMPACWRALADRSDVDLHILHPHHLLSRANPFDAKRLLDGLSHEMFDAEASDVDRWLLDRVTSKQPDVIVICGWIFWPYTRLVSAPELRDVRVVLGMDSPWRGSWKQRLARFRLAPVIDRTDLAVTATEQSSEYARRLGMPTDRIRTGFYGFDYQCFSSAMPRRSSNWPRRFLFAGRYVPEKDLATLVTAYRRYRDTVSEPWDLTCCGTGVDGDLLRGHPGVRDQGFTAPHALPAVFSEHGAFVLPSRFEPWGVVLAEAAAAGLPIVCTGACGASHDLVRPYYNGLVIAPGDVEGLARAMRWIHNHEAELPKMSWRGQQLAEAFSAESWASRWHNYLLDAIERPRGVTR